MSTFDLKITTHYVRPFNQVTGIHKLANLVEKYALTTFGSDEQNPNTGCYLKSIIGRTFTSEAEIAQEINEEISRIRDQIVQMQLREMESGVQIPKDEQLQSLSLVDVSFGEGLGSVEITYRVINREGEQIEGELVPN